MRYPSEHFTTQRTPVQCFRCDGWWVVLCGDVSGYSYCGSGGKHHFMKRNADVCKTEELEWLPFTGKCFS